MLDEVIWSNKERSILMTSTDQSDLSLDRSLQPGGSPQALSSQEGRRDPVRLLIFGATGGVGRQLVAQALEQGHRVTAFARDASALDVKHEHLTVVQGDVMDASSVDRAVPGHDAVLVALGSPPWRNTAVRSAGTRNVAKAMEKSGVSRLVCLSTLGAGDSWSTLPFKFKVLFRTLLRNAFAAHQRQELEITRSRLAWTIVRPGAYTDGDRTGVYRHGFPTSDTAIAAEISRADVADFMLRQLSDGRYVRQMPGLSYGR